MDFSNFHSDHPFYSKKRKNQVGFLKSEVACDDEITKFVGIKSKVYSFLTKKQVYESKCKGVKKTVKGELTFNVYKKCIDEISQFRIKQTSIISKNHQNKVMEMNKLSFSSFDDKRFLTCHVHSVPYGSKFESLYKKTKRCYLCDNPRIFM